MTPSSSSTTNLSHYSIFCRSYRHTFTDSSSAGEFEFLVCVAAVYHLPVPLFRAAASLLYSFPCLSSLLRTAVHFIFPKSYTLTYRMLLTSLIKTFCLMEAL